MSAGELRKQFLKRIGFRLSIIEDPHSRDCIFLRQTEAGKGCAIYPVRPKQCRNWPFWPGNLISPDSWNTAARKCPGVNRGRSYTPEQIQAQNDELWWRDVARNKEIVSRVGKIYKWLDDQTCDKNAKAGACDACCKCCDFESYGHRLYVTTPEILYLADKLGSSDFKQMTTGRCSYQVDGKCDIYRYRFAACRIFCCKGNAEFQSELAEVAIKKFKAICEEFRIPYRYV